MTSTRPQPFTLYFSAVAVKNWRAYAAKIEGMGVTTTPLTVEEFLKLPEEQTFRCELVHGEIVPMPTTGYTHERVKANAAQIFMTYVLQNPIGMIFSESMFVLGSHETRVPDVSLLLNEHIESVRVSKRLSGAPALTFETVSSETAAYMEHKIDLYLKQGCRVVCVAYPEERALWVYRPGGEARRLTETDFLEEPDLLPGFRVSVSKFFEGI